VPEAQPEQALEAQARQAERAQTLVCSLLKEVVPTSECEAARRA
jgi:hypothetical protein